MSEPSDDAHAQEDTPPEREVEGATSESENEDVQTLRRQVEEKYDFDDFGPADMAEMTAEEWDVAFDEESWITGEELLDRVERDLRSRVATRDVFARIERSANPPRVLAYSDEGYAIVYPDGSVEGEGTVLRDVKPTVALCSMDGYEVAESVPENPLPEPDAVPEGSGELGNMMLQVIAGVQLLAGVAMLAGAVLALVDVIGGPGANIEFLVVGGLAFVGVSLVLFFTVANARLSDKFRAEEYRDRLRAVGLDNGERPDFVPELAPENDRENGEAEDSDEVGA
jgi:hypothetical protein